MVAVLEFVVVTPVIITFNGNNAYFDILEFRISFCKYFFDISADVNVVVVGIYVPRFIAGFAEVACEFIHGESEACHAEQSIVGILEKPVGFGKKSDGYFIVVFGKLCICCVEGFADFDIAVRFNCVAILTCLNLIYAIVVWQYRIAVCATVAVFVE